MLVILVIFKALGSLDQFWMCHTIKKTQPLAQGTQELP